MLYRFHIGWVLGRETPLSDDEKRKIGEYLEETAFLINKELFREHDLMSYAQSGAATFGFETFKQDER